jgi:uncharacterized protein YkwD
MEEASKEPRMRAVRAVSAAFTAALLLVTGSTPALACDLLEICTEGSSPTEPSVSRDRTATWMVGAINAARADAGARRVTRDGSLDDLALGHARRMAKAAGSFHNQEGLRARRAETGETLGENVGVGPDLESVHRAFLGSSSHRHTLLGAAYERIGLGVVRRGGEVYVTQVFATRPGYGYAAPASRPASDVVTRPASRPEGDPVRVRSLAMQRVPPALAPAVARTPSEPGLWVGLSLGALVLATRRIWRLMAPLGR